MSNVGSWRLSSLFGANPALAMLTRLQAVHKLSIEWIVVAALRQSPTVQLMDAITSLGHVCSGCIGPAVASGQLVNSLTEPSPYLTG